MFQFRFISSVLLVGMLLAGSSFSGKLNSSFKVNVAKSSLKWFATKVTGKHDGQIKLISGTLSTKGNMISGGSFDIDMGSISCRDIEDKETNGKFLGHLKSPDFFDAGNHKTANFEIQKVVPKSGNEFEVTGKMTIKGISNEISFPATITNNGKEIRAKAKITLDRTKWDIRYGSGKFFEGLGDKIIHDDFVIELDMVANS
jgi:polyisoprenoid-binding protein YceI